MASEVLSRSVGIEGPIRMNPRRVLFLTSQWSDNADAHVAPFYAGKRWDACAADALIVAAGGRVTDAYGGPIDYRGPGLSNDRGLVATNGRIHDAILRKLEDLRSA